MSRSLFAAWRPDAAGQARLGALAGMLAGARPDAATGWAPRRADQWHVTLSFIGHDLRHLATPALLEAYAGAAAAIPPHAFELERLAYWAGSGAIVALPRPCLALQALCDATYDAARRCGIPPQEATTQPHITLAYLDTRLPPQGWLDGLDCTGDALRVASFELLFNAGGRYEALGRWALAGHQAPTTPGQPARS